MSNTSIYQNPLSERYSNQEIQKLFSNDYKFSTWRKLWVALAKAEKQLGLNITDEQITEMNEHIYDINYDVANEQEKNCRHDVMSHIYAYGKLCPKSEGIIHLGATSCYITDNTDIIIFKEALAIIKKELLGVIKLLSDFAIKNKNIVCLGYTHYQPAQLTTVGKRASLWIQDFLENLKELDYISQNLKLLGCKGTTGTQESFMKLFNGNHEKVKQLDKIIAKELGFSSTYHISSQTYPRSLDSQILDCLSHIAISCYKFANDLRLLQHEQELEEPFNQNQIGSSAMAYKRNPMRAERICSLSRHIIALSQDAKMTAMTQWLERSLDDSAVRRISNPEAFLTLDGILTLCANISDGIVVYEKVIQKNINEKLPFMATEEILMKSVLNGGNRQELHEKIRTYSMEVTKEIKLEGKQNNLLSKIAEDPSFKTTIQELQETLNPSNLCGRAPKQTEEFINEEVIPVLEKNKQLLENINKKVSI